MASSSRPLFNTRDPKEKHRRHPPSEACHVHDPLPLPPLACNVDAKADHLDRRLSPGGSVDTRRAWCTAARAEPGATRRRRRVNLEWKAGRDSVEIDTQREIAVDEHDLSARAAFEAAESRTVGSLNFCPLIILGSVLWP